MLEKLIIGEQCKVLSRKHLSNDEFKKEVITYLGTKVVSGYNKCSQNNTIGYMFETPRGVIILTKYSTFIMGNKNYYFSVYDNYNDNYEYDFLEV